MLRIGEHPENLKIRQILVQTMGAGRDLAIVLRFAGSVAVQVVSLHG